MNDKKKKNKKRIRLNVRNTNCWKEPPYETREEKKRKGTTAICVKNWHLSYEKELKTLQIELMKLQKHMQLTGDRILAIFEGRDAAGKAGTIKRITANLNPRNSRITALNKPNETESTEWYFQRYTQHLPHAGEMVLFDRSWYNRAMVEPVMFFVSKNVQKERFDSRKVDPLKQYKLSPVDNLAQEYWNDYSVRKFQMLSETNRTLSPWTIIRSDVKKKARINCIKFLLS